MAHPPPGYDDESVIHRSQLKRLLGEFEEELDRIQSLFEQAHPQHVESKSKLEHCFWAVKEASLELGTDYSFLLDQLIENYEQFSIRPDQETLSKIFSSVKSLQLRLAQH